MKRQRLKFKLLALLLFALFAVLAVYGGYSVVKYGNRWFASNRNPRVRAQKEAVIPGDILDRNGLVLATTDSEGSRVYPQPEAVRRALVHVVGDRQGQVSNSVESFQTSYLYGFHASVGEVLSALWKGEDRHGDTVRLTIDAELNTYAASLFTSLTGGKRGAAVVMNWQTGEVLGLISLPAFDPEQITDAVKADEGQPFWNRALQSLYPPGSTFKVVTAAGALMASPELDSFRFMCTDAPLALSDGHSVRDYGSTGHGELTWQQAFTVSCNKAFATLALDMGQQALLSAASSFGFNDNFLFRDLVVENSSFPTAAQTVQELAACGFGQSSIVASPMHMCMVAAGIANGGMMMEPRLLYEVTSPTGAQRLGFTTAIYRRAVSEDIAATLKAAMRSVVTSGTGRQAAVTGMTICGKTGTADSTANGNPVTYGWFTGFCADASAPYALCVLVEDIGSGTSGGSVAAPIARGIFEWLREYR